MTDAAPARRSPRADGFPAGPSTLRSARLLTRFFDDPIAWYCDLREEWGDLVGVRAGPAKLIACFDVDLLERILIKEARSFVKGDALRATRFVLGNGLITSDGEWHRSHRKLAAPLFTPRTIEPFAGATVSISREMLETWPTDGIAQVAGGLYDVSLRVAGVGLFGTDFDAAERSALRAAMADLDKGYRVIVAPGGDFLVRHGLTPAAHRMRAGRDHVDDVIRAIVAQRRLDSDSVELGDLLSRLLAARDDDGMTFSDEEVRDEAVTMLLAGHDTTAATLGWSIALLALHPHEQALARAEVDTVLGTARPATASDLRSLVRIRAIVDETLRLHPVVYSTVRQPVEPMHLPSGQTLSPGTDIVVPIGAIHRDPALWDEPLEFRPERFADPAGAGDRHRMAYLPFGTGPRVCIGSSFALQELVLVLATILQSHEIHAPTGWELEPHVGFIRRPAGELPLRVVKRRTSRDPV